MMDRPGLPILATPSIESLDHGGQAPPRRSQAVFDPGRPGRVALTLHNPGQLQPPEPLCQHVGRDRGEVSLEITKAPGTAQKYLN